MEDVALKLPPAKGYERVTLEDGREVIRPVMADLDKLRQYMPPGSYMGEVYDITEYKWGLDPRWNDSTYRYQGVSGTYGYPVKATVVTRRHPFHGAWEIVNDTWLKYRDRFRAHAHLLLAHNFGPVEKAEGDPAKLLEYSFSAAHAAQGKRTMIRVRAYLHRYWKEVFTPEEIEDMAQTWEAENAPRKVHLLTDANEIEEAYTTRRFGSCMGYSRSAYRSSVHPTAVYADSDLAVAVIYEPGAEPGEWDRVAARCIVWPDKKRVSGNIYGDYGRMRAALAQAGYEVDNDDFTGARLRHIICENTDCTVLPYLDITEYAGVDGDWVVLGKNGDLDTYSTSGLGEDEHSRTYCEHCDEQCDEDYLYTVYGRHGSSELWCECCRDSDAFYCVYEEEYYRDSLLGGTGPNGESYSEGGLRRGMERDRLFICNGDGHVYSTYYDSYVTAEDDGETYHSDASCLVSDDVWDQYVTDSAETVELSDGSLTWADDPRYGSEEYFAKLREMGVTDPNFPLHHAMEGRELEGA